MLKFFLALKVLFGSLLLNQLLAKSIAKFTYLTKHWHFNGFHFSFFRFVENNFGISAWYWRSDLYSLILLTFNDENIFNKNTNFVNHFSSSIFPFFRVTWITPWLYDCMIDCMIVYRSILSSPGFTNPPFTNTRFTIRISPIQN